MAIAGGALALVNLTAVTAAIGAAGGPAAAPVRPALSTYLLGGGFLVTALLVWAWAERSGRRS
jgi:hypothetical protein